MALQQNVDSTRLSDLSAKARRLIFQRQPFNFIFPLNMLEPIFSVIFKVSTNLQSEQLGNLTSSQYQADDEEYNNSIQMCD
ncbi:Hypothetical protein CINCED_3A004216 [Cinara cedri]|uniref:Uncharacterized protein n=1 Tax=Cinara cedri TaxID=506608 RepID=A0A5E4NHK4_9HEMI|nr:Hypothetical protein CINCED_3A004216 [Cinara cedri]